jgi:hypothetical protein
VSGRHDHAGAEGRAAVEAGETPRPRGGVLGGVVTPTRREWATVCSMPTILLVVYFLVQPALDAWPRLGYVRYSVARQAPGALVAPEPFAAYAPAWHELTRVSHALIHAPGPYHAHVLGNAALILVTAWALLLALIELGERRWFVFLYWELVVVAPVVGSFAFDLFGRTAHGYGASTVGFAFLGVVAVVGTLALAGEARRRLARRFGPGPTLRSDGGTAVYPGVVAGVLVVAVAVVVADAVYASPATPVHPAGVAFGALVGAVAVPLARLR